MIGGSGPQKITVEIGGKIAASLGRSIKAAQMQVSSFGRNVTRTMNDAAISGRKGFKGMFDNALWQQAAIGATGITVALGASIRTAASFEAVLSDIGKTANVGAVELKGLSSEVLRLSSRNLTNLAPEKLAQGIQDLVAQGLELKDAVASMEALGKVATATNSDLLDVTKTGFQLQNALKIRPTELKATFDALAFAGKQGAFELKDMAQFMPTIAAAAGTLGIQGRQGAVSLAAMMQMVRKDAPDAGQAATRLTDAMLKMTAPDAVKNFKKFGVDIEQVLKNARAKGVNPMEAAISELQRVTGGDVFKLSRIFGDKEAKLALMSLMKYRKEYAQLKAEAGGKAAAGTVEKDFQRSLGTFQGTLASFQNSAQRLGITVGNALLPPLTRIAEFITPVVEGIANWAAANPGLMTGIVAIGGALAGLVIALPIIAGVVVSIGTIGTAIGGVAAAFPVIAGLGTVFMVLATGPVGIAVAAIAGFAALAFVVIKNWTPISGFFSRLWQSVVSITMTVGPRLLGIFLPIPALIINLFTGAGIGQRIIGSILDGLKARAGALFSWVGGAVQRIGSMVSGGGGGGVTAPAAPVAVGPTPQPRALGGRVIAGMDYLVGERRPEIFRPDRSGRILPRISQLAPTAQPRAMGGGSITADEQRAERPSRIIPRAPRPAAPAPQQLTFNAGGITINAPSGNGPDIRAAVLDALDEFQRNLASTYRLALND
jgi:TP901 family phage tail tape measure protein